jgi:hypothetical protein
MEITGNKYVFVQRSKYADSCDIATHKITKNDIASRDSTAGLVRLIR